MLFNSEYIFQSVIQNFETGRNLGSHICYVFVIERMETNRLHNLTRSCS